jgi:hypothetical protein
MKLEPIRLAAQRLIVIHLQPALRMDVFLNPTAVTQGSFVIKGVLDSNYKSIGMGYNHLTFGG